MNDLLLAPHEMDRATQVGPFVSQRSSYSFSLATSFCAMWSIPFQVQIVFQVCRGITNKK